jgi:hypothetical protein
MTYEELVQLHRRTRDAPVLSAYLPAPTDDQAGAGDAVVEGGLFRIRQSLSQASRAEREALRSASDHLRGALNAMRSWRGAPGEVAFADATGVIYVGALRERPRALVEWRQGILVAPYLYTLFLARPSIVTLIDAREARLFRHQDDHLEALEHLRATLAAESAPEAGRHPPHVPAGDADREAVAFERLLAGVVHRLETIARPDAWLIVGGMPLSTRQLVAALPKGLAARLQLVNGLTTASAEAEVIQAAREAEAQLRRRQDGVQVDLALNRGGAGGRALLGYRQTLRALEERTARRVLMSRKVVECCPERAERVARLALDGGVHVDVAPEVGGARLDDECEGVAVELRYAVPFEAVAHARSGVATR